MGEPTKLDSFNTNASGDYGDWAGSAGNDAFLAFANAGVALPVSATDLTVMDAIGWNLAAPGAPVITNDTLNANNSVTLNGTAEATSTVTIYDGATVLGTTTVADSGAWSYTTTALPSGNHAFTATDTDITGNTGATSGSLNVTIGSTSPTVTSVAATGTGISNGNGDLSVGNVVTLTLNMSEAVTVAGGTPALTLNDGGTATYISGSRSNALVFSYTVLAGQNTSDLAISAVTLNGATITDGAGNNASFSGTLTPAGTLQIDTTTPTVSSVAESPSSGDLDAGKTVTLTLNLSEAVTVAGGTPTLTLNDGGTATYISGSGSNALVFSYTVGAGQNTTGLAATAVNLNAATISDGAGNAANLSLTGLTQTGPQIDTTTPTVSSVAESPSSGDLDAGKTVTLTLNLSEAVTVAGGTPTLTLNDGGSATYISGSGSNALVFSYTVGAAQNTTGLAATAVNLNAATISDGAGNAANLSLTGLTQTGPQIDTTMPAAPTINSFSPDSGVAGDNITNATKLTLTGTAEADSTVDVFDGSTELGTTTANSTDVWNYTTGTLSNGSHSFTADAVDAAGNVGTISAALIVAVDTIPPPAPTITSDTVNQNNSVTLSGSGAANDTVTVYDGKTDLGTTKANSSGLWNYTTGALASGSQVLTATATDFAGNVSAVSNVIDPNIGSIIATDGSTSLAEVANEYFIYKSGGSGLALRYGGAHITAGEFGAWTPIGAVQTSTGYEVAVQFGTADEYTIWTVDNSGNVTDTFGVVAGNSYALELLEFTFNQDLNGDGVIGVTKTVIQVDGSTGLAEVANEYFIYESGGSGLALSYGGAPITAGEFGAWTPIGAVQTSTGYEVAVQFGTADEYTIWTVDNSGNVTDTFGVVAGNSYALESLESTFNQDLNGDGVIGVTKTVIQVDGSTGLAEVANEYFIYESGGSGLALSYGGAPITAGEFGAWTPIGAVQTSTGYEVAVQFGTADEYTIWTVDSSGNVTDTFGVVAGNSYALESLESRLQPRLEWRWEPLHDGLADGHQCVRINQPDRSCGPSFGCLLS